VVVQAYRFALDPTPRQERALLRHVGAARVAFNWGLARVRAVLDQRAAERSCGRLVVADRWFPSSKTCSGCGVVTPKLPLSARTFTCTTCGVSLHRDHNAAINLAQLVVVGSGPETKNGRRADRKTPAEGQVAMKRQPGTAPAGKTGTVPPQGGTADHALTLAH
jgi:putative transposase